MGIRTVLQTAVNAKQPTATFDERTDDVAISRGIRTILNHNSSVVSIESRVETPHIYDITYVD